VEEDGVTDTKKRVLIVDDSDLVLQVAKEALNRAGFEATTAQTMGALERHEGLSFDLILMDVQMPELFGDDVAMVLKAVRGVDAPIYLYSNLDPEELEARATEAELDGFILKRDGVEALVGRVRSILGVPEETA
jgi:DNA-binding response OmpR family regulator